jgi:hypothetical protein
VKFQNSGKSRSYMATHCQRGGHKNQVHFGQMESVLFDQIAILGYVPKLLCKIKSNLVKQKAFYWTKLQFCETCLKFYAKQLDQVHAMLTACQKVPRTEYSFARLKGSYILCKCHLHTFIISCT